jgi:predicted DNA-binding protein (MmcQ/YjbR family)
MVRAPDPDRVIERIRSVCLALPETVEKPFGGHTSPAFRVRDKLFVVIAEERSYMTLKAPPGVQGILVNSDGERFFVPPYVGSKGWVGVRIALNVAPDWDEVAEMIYESYRLTAPKRLVDRVEAEREARPE